MANPLLGQVLGAVFANAMRGRARSGPFGRSTVGSSVGGAALGGVLGGMLGRGGSGRRGMGGRGMLLAMLLPYAMQWVQRNGGVGAVLDRFRSKGLGHKAQSWVSTGANEGFGEGEIDDVIGRDELSRLAQRLGVSEQEVSQGFAEIVPEMVDQLSPEGQLPPEADDALEAGRSELEKELSELSRMTQHAPA
jgi:uncharacterized protein YidB (DUF937 family)